MDFESIYAAEELVLEDGSKNFSPDKRDESQDEV